MVQSVFIFVHVKKVPILGIPMLHRGVQQQLNLRRGWVPQPWSRSIGPLRTASGETPPLRFRFAFCTFFLHESLFFSVLASLHSFLLVARFYPQNLILAEVWGVVNSIPTSETILGTQANFILDKGLNIYYHKLDL